MWGNSPVVAILIMIVCFVAEGWGQDDLKSAVPKFSKGIVGAWVVTDFTEDQVESPEAIGQLVLISEDCILFFCQDTVVTFCHKSIRSETKPETSQIEIAGKANLHSGEKLYDGLIDTQMKYDTSDPTNDPKQMTIGWHGKLRTESQEILDVRLRVRRIDVDEGKQRVERQLGLLKSPKISAVVNRWLATVSNRGSVHLREQK